MINFKNCSRDPDAKSQLVSHALKRAPGMTTELSEVEILHEHSERRPASPNIGTIPVNRWLNSVTQSESATDTDDSTPTDPLDIQIHPSQSATNIDSVPRPLLVKSRTTGDADVRRYDESRRQFLNANEAPLATRRFTLANDYGLDELRAPPILPDRERRKSLEHAWSRRPSIAVPQPPKQRLFDDFVVGCWITFLSIWGSLARIGLSALSTYPGEPVFPLIWSQFVGCALMGFLLQDKSLFPKEDRYVALYIGLTTGLCGSITSFSSFMWECFQSMANIDPYYDRATGRNVLALAAQVIITLCVSIAALRFGAHVAQLMRHSIPSIRQMGKLKRYLDVMGIILGVAGWAAAGIMAGLIPKWRAELFTAVLGPAGTSPSQLIKVFWPVGALCRWQLSRFNPVIPSFPLGTFSANIIATLILGIAILIQGRNHVTLTQICCQLLYGVENGFCGCLSTVSTLAVELDTLIRGHAYVYATVSIFVGIVILAIVVGVPAWTVGYQPMCGLWFELLHGEDRKWLQVEVSAYEFVLFVAAAKTDEDCTGTTRRDWLMKTDVEVKVMDRYASDRRRDIVNYDFVEINSGRWDGWDK